MMRGGFGFVVLGIWLLQACASDEGSTPPPSSQPTPSPQKPIFNWTPQVTNTTIDFHDVFFMGNNAGWVVGEAGVLLSTVNGGVAWPAVPVNALKEDFQSVFLVNDQKGWIASRLSDNQTGGNVLISINGGAYPEPQLTVDSPLNTVFFVDELTGWAAGTRGQIFHTTNGGTQWDTGNIGAEIEIYDLYFLNKNTGWAAADSGGIYRTLDGITWQAEMLTLTASLHAIHFVDTLHGWACGTNNSLLRKTQETGKAPAWTSVNIDFEAASMVWTDVFFTDAQTGWVVGKSGIIYKSTDGGANWNRETTPTRSNLNAIHMVSSTKGWIVGEEGVILTYTP